MSDLSSVLYVLVSVMLLVTSVWVFVHMGRHHMHDR